MASSKKKEERKISDVISVVRTGDSINVPERIELDEAAKLILEEYKSQSRVVEVRETVNCWPFDGALALKRVLLRHFGYALEKGKTLNGFFGPVQQKPKFFNVETSYGVTEPVFWGTFQVPGITGTIDCDFSIEQGRPVFQVSAEVLKRDESVVREIVQRLREEVRENSIYSGKAVRLSFKNDRHGVGVDEPRFMDATPGIERELVLNDDLRDSVMHNIMAPMVFTDECRKASIPLKRGVLLAGPYGTGKTMLAKTVSIEAQRNGWTFLYIEDVSYLSNAIKVAEQYQPAVIFAEDADRALSSRDDSANTILNTIDGIEQKGSEIMVVLTTNHLDDIHPAMLRPGRLDAVLRVEAPDAKSVLKLIRIYGRDMLTGSDKDFEPAARVLEGQIPALIREAVERSKLSAIWRSGSTDKSSSDEPLSITGSDVLAAAKQVVAQVSLLNKEEKPDEQTARMQHTAEVFGEALAKGLREGSISRLEHEERRWLEPSSEELSEALS